MLTIEIYRFAQKRLIAQNILHAITPRSHIGLTEPLSHVIRPSITYSDSPGFKSENGKSDKFFVDFLSPSRNMQL